MTEEDEEFNRIEREANMRMAAVSATVAKREWVGLTDEEIMEMLDYGQYGRLPRYARNFVDAIEYKLREKNI
jgi:hypothetical protein